MKGLKSKRGVSPTEIIISFLLFIGFIVFIFSYMNPLKAKAVLPDNEALASEIERYAAVDLDRIGLRAEGAGCFDIPNPFSGNIFVEDENGIKVDSKISGNSIKMEGGRTFYYIFDNGDLTENASLNNCRTVNHSFSVQSVLRVYSYIKLQEMNSSYSSDYHSLKNSLKSEKDFGVIIFDESRNRVFEMSRNIPKTQVIATEYPIEILKDNEIMKGAIRIGAY